MERLAMESLKTWKASQTRKPLIIRGARQVGKTWLAKNFGAMAYDNFVYINFDHNKHMQELFSRNFNIDRIILGLEIYCNNKINMENTLIIFDEVQEVPLALTSLKYFYENAPEYHIICAGSMLGIGLHPGTSFPVGKIDFLYLYPLTFIEFLLALGEYKLVKLLNSNDYDLISIFKYDLIDLLKFYYYVGGMPEAVYEFSKDKDFLLVRNIQEQILDGYVNDFSKHAPGDTPLKMRWLWSGLPGQLAREKKKFIFGHIKEGARAKDFESALMWLVDCGLVHKVSRATSPKLPLMAYEDAKAFKLFLLDVGLLSVLVGLDQRVLLEENRLFSEYSGALTEQYVFQQLITIKKHKIFYWSNDRNSAEIDFILDNGMDIIPMEVKAKVNLKSKSLKVFREKYRPNLSLRASMADYVEQDGLINLPLYALNGYFTRFYNL
ncbi:MAG: ATP-binding protein [Deltaproteobacteria bacterium]|nr:ATP-binding protein [Deltaproteobacteria bacterium]